MIIGMWTHMLSGHVDSQDMLYVRSLRHFFHECCASAGKRVSEQVERLMIIDMGTHMLSGHVGSQNLLQVAVPGLEDRCRTFGPLQGVLLMPGIVLSCAVLCCAAL